MSRDRRAAGPRSIASTLVAVALLVAAQPLAASAGPGTDSPTAERLEAWRAGGGSLQVLDPLIAVRIEALRARSARFERAWQALRRSGVPIVIGTREQMESDLPRRVRGSRAWAAVTLSWEADHHRVGRVAVAVRSEWLRELHRRHGNDRTVFIRALDELLVHEIYGHASPLVAAGDVRRQCRDAAPGERPEDACVVRREREVLAELYAAARPAAPPGSLAADR